jgi:ATP-dependent RNA helicase SUPV3L1/SUV3
VSRELSMRTRRVVAAKAEAFKLTRKGQIMWRGDEIAEVAAADDALKPVVTLLVDESISGPDREKLQTRLDAWIGETIADKLKPLADIAKAEDVTGLARGIAFQLTENLGALKRESVADEIKSLDQTARSQLRKYGVRFGAFNVFFPPLLKPGPAELTSALWCVKHGAAAGLQRETLPEPPRPGLTSVAADATIPEAFYRAAGYHVCGPRAVRLDILERLADLIRPLLAYRTSKDPTNPTTPPRGSTGEGGFLVLPEMMSILGCSPDELSAVLKSLGFSADKRLVPVVPAKAVEPAVPGPAVPLDATPAVVASGESETASPQTVPVEATVPVQTTASVVAVASAEVTGPSDAAKPGETKPREIKPDETKPDELKYEDVWRPRRAHQHSSGDRRPREPQGERTARDRSRYRRPPGTDAPVATVAGPGGAVTVDGAASPAVKREGDRGPRPDRGGERSGDRNRGRGTDAPRRDRPADGPSSPRAADTRPGGGRNDRSGPRPNRDGGRDRERDDRRGPKVISASPAKSSSNVDSPFAALQALREQLANQGKEKSK